MARGVARLQACQRLLRVLHEARKRGLVVLGEVFGRQRVGRHLPEQRERADHASSALERQGQHAVDQVLSLAFTGG